MPRQGMKKKSTSFRENRIGKYGEKDHLSFSPFLIYGFGVTTRCSVITFILLLALLTSLIQWVFTMNLLNHTNILHPCLFFCPPQKEYKNLHLKTKQKTSTLCDLPAGQNTEPSKEDDGNGVGSTQQPVVVERPRYPLAQFFSQGHPQLSSPSCHPGIHQGDREFQHVQRFSKGTVSS